MRNRSARFDFLDQRTPDTSLERMAEGRWNLYLGFDARRGETLPEPIDTWAETVSHDSQ